MPFDRAKYPADWEAVSLLIRGLRARWRCEWAECRAVNGQPHPETGSRVVLTVAHLDESDDKDVPMDRLLALCQAHHLRLDAKLHARNAAITRRGKAVAAGQAQLGDVT